MRSNVVKSVIDLAEYLFNDIVENFIVGSFRIVISTRALDFDKKRSISLICYTIATIDTDYKILKTCHNETFDQFLNRYTLYDIINKPSKKFKDFSKRFDSIFGDIVSAPQKRLCNIF